MVTGSSILAPMLEGRRRRGRSDQEIDLLEGRSKVVGDQRRTFCAFK
jgi:hypothetical protein